MKIKNVLLLIVALSLLLCSCNDATITTEPAPSALESASLEEYPPNPALAKQVFDELQAGGVGNSKYSYFSMPLSQAESADNFPYVDYYLYDDVNAPAFPSRQEVEKIHPGLFINEVYDLLGAPHYNSEYRPMQQGFYPWYDMFTMYVLDDGNILLLRYSALYYGKYEWSELSKRIPYEKYYTDVIKVGADYSWKELISVEILSLEALAEKSMAEWGRAEHMTAAEYMPEKITYEAGAQIKAGMTYGQIKEKLGNGGYCYIYYNENHTYTFEWLISEDGYQSLVVRFEPLAEGGEYFDDLVANSVTIQ